ncbi:hypothetical protein GXW82_04275 [Streptacidiphilus sp. 4-A2]|nr:hypothetical protein [Streptacidiphilus sp. 4-A2]
MSNQQAAVPELPAMPEPTFKERRISGAPACPCWGSAWCCCWGRPP